jgi:hypothetical protein
MNNGIGRESWREREHSEWSLIDIYYSFFVLYLILPRPTGLSYFAGFFKDLIPVMLFFLFFTYSGLFRWQFCGHCCFYDFLKNMEIWLLCWVYAGTAFFCRTGIIIVFISIKIHREEKRNREKMREKLIVNYADSPRIYCSFRVASDVTMVN